VNLKDRYIQEQIKRQDESSFKTYEQWLENLCQNLINENSLLCPIGDLDTIQSLLVEKKMLMEQIAEYEEVMKLYVQYVLKN
jgi:hypothetical protein